MNAQAGPSRPSSLLQKKGSTNGKPKTKRQKAKARSEAQIINDLERQAAEFVSLKRLWYIRNAYNFPRKLHQIWLTSPTCPSRRTRGKD